MDQPEQLLVPIQPRTGISAVLLLFRPCSWPKFGTRVLYAPIETEAINSRCIGPGRVGDRSYLVIAVWSG